jgi:hypothetical protein
LIAINGHLGSEIGDHLLDFARSQDPKHWDMAVESAKWHKQAFANSESDSDQIPRAYVELQHHVPEQNAINPLLIKLARQEGMPLICDNDSHFLRAEDHDAHDTLICISTGKNKSDPNRMRYSTELYVKSPEQMEELFGGDSYNSEAVRRTRARRHSRTPASVAAACNVELPLGKNNSPSVRIDLPEASRLPDDDAKYAGDLTAWYKDYCPQLQPFTTTTAEELDKSGRLRCGATLLADRGFKCMGSGPRMSMLAGPRPDRKSSGRSSGSESFLLRGMLREILIHRGFSVRRRMFSRQGVSCRTLRCRTRPISSPGGHGSACSMSDRATLFSRHFAL